MDEFIDMGKDSKECIVRSLFLIYRKFLQINQV